MSDSLATKYRPKEFSECIGQSSVIKILERQIALKNFKHAILFTGASGCGKTTLARILASKINGSLNGLEELDGASNNGVENIRTIIKGAYERSVSSKYKIILIDECHALSNAAWQALLKCIEEPPEFTIFMFCTTEINKVPATIINRCQRYNISKISSSAIESRLRYICEQEGFTNFEETIQYISKTCNGGARDAIASLEKVASYSTDMPVSVALEALGAYSYKMFFDFANNIIDGNLAEVTRVIDSIHYKGNDVKLFVDQFFTFCLDVSKYCIFGDINLTEIPKSEEENLKNCTNFQNAATYYMYIVDCLVELKATLKNERQVKPVVEASFLKLARWGT